MPVPGPASTSNGPPGWSTTRCWWSSRSGASVTTCGRTSRYVGGRYVVGELTGPPNHRAATRPGLTRRSRSTAARRRARRPTATRRSRPGRPGELPEADRCPCLWAMPMTTTLAPAATAVVLPPRSAPSTKAHHSGLSAPARRGRDQLAHDRHRRRGVRDVVDEAADDGRAEQQDRRGEQLVGRPSRRRPRRPRSPITPTSTSAPTSTNSAMKKARVAHSTSSRNSSGVLATRRPSRRRRASRPSTGRGGGPCAARRPPSPGRARPGSARGGAGR